MNYFRIHFVRKNSTTPNRAWNDDILTITPSTTADDEYEIQYTESDSRLKYTCTLQKNHLEQYVETILGNLTADSDPFESIQILCPCLPSTLIPIEELVKNEALERTIRLNLQFFLRVHTTVTYEDYVPPILRRRRRPSTVSDSSSSDSSADTDASSQTAEDVDEDGFQRLPREADEEPEPTHHDEVDRSAHADGATEPTVQPGSHAAQPTEPLQDGLQQPQEPIQQPQPQQPLQGVPWGNSTVFPPTYPLFWTVWMPYR